MSKREEYNACMRPYITGSKSKEQRKLDFCIGAKVCSGKAKDREEAEKICLLPKVKPVKQEQDEEPCLECEVANAIAAIAAICKAHPGKIDCSIIEKSLEAGVNTVDEWLDIFDKIKDTCSEDACLETMMVEKNLTERIGKRK
jgi:transcription elongation factor Elf1